ncbi:MAG: transporter substrate-binding domain-containing protein [Akkermansiaceae bacterium]
MHNPAALLASRVRKFLLSAMIASLCACSPKSASGPAPLRVGMELSTPPFEMVDTAGNPDGIGVRLAEALAKDLGRPLDIQVMAFKGLETALKTGKIDLILSSMTDTPKRRESIDFSDAYCKIGLALLVANDSDIQGPTDLNQPGRKIVARLGTTAVEFVKTQLPKAELVLLDQNAACLLEVTQKKADAFIYDQLSILKLHLAQPENTRALLNPLQTESWAMALRKDDAALKESINLFLKNFRASGGMDALGEKYLKAEKSALRDRGVPFVLE